LTNQNAPKQRRRSWRPILLFTSLNAIPLAAVAWYLKDSIDARQEELRQLSQLWNISASEASARIEAICRTCVNTVLIAGDAVYPVSPHAPENSPLVLTKDEVIENIDATIPGTSAVFDQITASRDVSQKLPLSFIHLGLSAKSGAMRRIKDMERSMTIVYSGGPFGDVSISVKGIATVIDDERLRRFYWRDHWSSFIPRDDFVLIKFIPSELSLNTLVGGADLSEGFKLVRVDNEWKML
jgi:hypothetical protein